jgi:AcrR family transcriptional regulator
MGSLERREREKRELRQKILDAARELFATEGFEATTMRRIAERIEYSPTAIYLHFADKEALLQELCTTDFQSLAQRFVQLEKLNDPVKRLRQLGQAYADFGLAYPEAYRFMFMTPKPTQAPEGNIGNPVTDPYALLREVITQCIEAGALKPHLKDVDLVAQTMWAGLHGVIALHLVAEKHEKHNWRPVEKRVKAMLDMLTDWVAR